MENIWNVNIDPEESGEYLITYEYTWYNEKKYRAMDIIEFTLHENDEIGYWEYGENHILMNPDMNGVILAWMPIPKPYSGK